LIEVSGGRVSFPSPENAPIDLHVNMGGQQQNLIIVAPNENNGQISFIVNEPIRGARVLGILVGAGRNGTASACVEIYDLTDAPRQSFGGFSVISIESRKDHKLKVEGSSDFLSPVAEISDAVVRHHRDVESGAAAAEDDPNRPREIHRETVR
jgi:hypothetical protein